MESQKLFGKWDYSEIKVFNKIFYNQRLMMYVSKTISQLLSIKHKSWYLTLQEDGNKRNLEKFNAQLLKD